MLYIIGFYSRPNGYKQNSQHNQNTYRNEKRHDIPPPVFNNCSIIEEIVTDKGKKRF